MQRRLSLGNEMWYGPTGKRYSSHVRQVSPDCTCRSILQCLTKMNNLELERQLKDFPVRVTCADEMPISIGKWPRTYVNTDPCSLPGSHWTMFHFLRLGPPEFSDSMGERAKTYNSCFEYVLANNGLGYLHTPDQIKLEDSDTCGAYCNHFGREGYRHHSFLNALKDCSREKLEENNRKVLKFIRGKKRIQRGGHHGSRE